MDKISTLSIFISICPVGSFILIVSSDKVSLNVDNFGTQDLSVYFEKKGAGYNLREGQWITVRFLMKSTGGCFLPFGGERATIVHWRWSNGY